MSRFLSIGLASAMGLVIASNAAQAGFKPGQISLQLSAGFAHTQDSDVSTLNGDATVSYFLTQGIELGAIQGLNYTFIDDDDDVWNASTVGFANYNFGGPDSTFVPFIGAFAGIVYNDEDATGTLGPNGGLKIFVNDTTFASIRYRYEWFVEELEQGDVDDNASDGNHVVTIGLGVNF